jgi:hypothetical protein
MIMKKQLLLLVLMMLPLVASADAVEIDGIWYNLVSKSKTAEVTRNPNVGANDGCYSGDIIIPSKVTCESVEYDVTVIGYGTFFHSSGLTTINIPNSVISIGSYAFSGCIGLTSVTIPNSVTSIGEAAFDSSGLTSITIPNSVTNIADWTFYNCKGLTSVTISNSVTSIGMYAFGWCSSLTSITIPNSVTSIGSFAFYGADIPIVITLIENPFAIYGKTSGYKTFSLNTFNNATLYVPQGTIDKYKATEGWKDFVFIEEGIPSGIKGAHLDDDKSYPIYDINGRRLEAPQRGINIINGKKVVIK